jgi:hypothetical protein
MYCWMGHRCPAYASASMRLWRLAGPPLVIWAATATTVAVGAAAFGYSPFHGSTWARWDSTHYLTIAKGGYEFYRCPPDYPFRGWCGNAGWFPAYPWGVGALHHLGLPLPGIAAVVPWLFTAGTLVLLWNTFFGRRASPTVLAALVYAAFAPGQIYDYAVFPLSMLAFFTVAHLWFLHCGRWIAAGLAGGVAALSYPLGVLLVPVSAAWLLIDRAVDVRERLRRITLASGLTLGGVVVLVIDQKIETGRWNAYTLVQDKYGHHFQNPIAATRESLRPLVHGSPFALSKAPAWQTALVTLALVAIVLWALRNRHTLDRVDALILLWAIPTWALPLSQAAVSIQRSQAALLPLAIAVRRLPRPLIAFLVVLAVPIAVAMEKLFLQGKIV